MNISPNITKALGRSLVQVQKHSPIILTAVGIAGVVTAGVLAARATLKLEETLDNAKLRLDLAENNDGNKTKAVVQNTLSLVKLYGPSITLGAASLVCIVSAQGILHKRNAALVVAYKGLETAYQNYRDRVVEAYGEDVDRDFHLGLRNEEVTDDKGKKHTVKVPADGVKPTGEYTFLFGPDNPNWVGTHEHNEFFLLQHQAVLNDLLVARGHVFLNEALDRLGMERTPAGAVTGWVYKPNDPNHTGDNFIDFRMQFLADTTGADMLTWPVKYTWLLDMNVDGTIYDKI